MNSKTTCKCPHDDLTNLFLHYNYCIKCWKRVHIVMQGQFGVVRFEECRENRTVPKKVFGEDEEPCNCDTVIQLNEGERLT